MSEEKTQRISTAIIRHVDDLGRVVIPREIRHKYGIADETPIEFYLQGDGILLVPKTNYSLAANHMAQAVRCLEEGELASITGDLLPKLCQLRDELQSIANASANSSCTNM